MSKFYLKEFAKPVNAPKNKEIPDKDKYFVYNMDSKKILSTGPYILKEYGNERAILKKILITGTKIIYVQKASLLSLIKIFQQL